jgi:hypothetical protein
VLLAARGVVIFDCWCRGSAEVLAVLRMSSVFPLGMPAPFFHELARRMIERSEIIRLAGIGSVQTVVTGPDLVCSCSTSRATVRDLESSGSSKLLPGMCPGRQLAGPSNRLHGRFYRGIGPRPLKTSLDAPIESGAMPQCRRWPANRSRVLLMIEPITSFVLCSFELH